MKISLFKTKNNVMATKLHPQDFGFPTWIAMYKHLEENMVNINRQKSFVFKRYESRQDYVAGNVKTVKITLQTLERNCWKEIKDATLSESDSLKLLHACHQLVGHDTEFIHRVNKLINIMSTI